MTVASELARERWVPGFGSSQDFDDPGVGGILGAAKTTEEESEMQRPEPSEYAEYYGLYVNQVPEGGILDLLARGVRRTGEMLGSLPTDWETYSYAPGKWSIREVVGHIVDTERLFGYRALSMARADAAALPGMDQDQWSAASNAADRPLAALLSDLERARHSSIALFESFDDAMWDRSGTASDCHFGVRSFPYIMAGHEIHHQKVLDERYLKPLGARDR